jgi:hypothetical protein
MLPVLGIECFVCFSLFVWVWRFLIFHKTAGVDGCFLGLQGFSAPVSVWDTRFFPHAIHGSMLKWAGCGCECMLEGYKISHVKMEENLREKQSNKTIKRKLERAATLIKLIE